MQLKETDKRKENRRKIIGEGETMCGSVEGAGRKSSKE